MTNNPTIDGVSRELLERACANIFRTFGGVKVINELRELLDAPVVERQPVGYVHQWEMERIAAGNAHWATMWDSDGADNPSRNGSPAMAVYLVTPEIAALQSTIAQLRIDLGNQTELTKQADYHASQRGNEIAQLQARVQGLESGRGEADAWALLNGNGQIRDLTDRWDVAKHWDGIVESLYFAPPAPVAVMLPERKSGHATETQAAYLRGWNACLDATAALNGPAK